mmetsp:Transcript_36120/g.53853  ORF Transcript_36120/g.53853 Transcript_36120/m.53853 type:complete len:200 (-) Transcript_36120:344-943(-)
MILPRAALLQGAIAGTNNAERTHIKRDCIPVHVEGSPGTGSVETNVDRILASDQGRNVVGSFIRPKLVGFVAWVSRPDFLESIASIDQDASFLSWLTNNKFVCGRIDENRDPVADAILPRELGVENIVNIKKADTLLDRTETRSILDSPDVKTAFDWWGKQNNITVSKGRQGPRSESVLKAAILHKLLTDSLGLHNGEK